MTRVRGRIRVPPGRDGSAVLARVMGDLRTRGCQVRMGVDGQLLLETGAPGRYSPLSFVDGGEVWLLTGPKGTFLRYDLSTRGGFLLCAILSPAAAALAWFGTGVPGLTLFGLLAPLLWLYGGNYAVACVRVPGLLETLVRAVGPPPIEGA